VFNALLKKKRVAQIHECSTTADAGVDTATQAKRDAFVNQGLVNWKQVRSDWTKNSTEKASGTGGDGGGSGDDDDDDFDPEQTIYCLRNYRKFPKNIPLSSMVEMLNVLWDDEGL
jgi:hypothetical protein